MKNKFVIGVDIGGTNTDAVLVDENEAIVSAVKVTTTEDISVGFSKALKQLLDLNDTKAEQIERIFLGTTHATNAILQKKDLYRVGVIRIAGHHPETLPAAFMWPHDLKQAVLKGVETINGGFECHGKPITPFSESQAEEAIHELLEKNVESLAIVGVFSPLNGEQEKQVAHLIKKVAGPNFPYSLSHEIGGVGFVERENSTILNAALQRVMQTGFYKLQAACQGLKLHCPLQITQNDGSLIEMERAEAYPVLTISAGPTNSFIGAMRLSKLDQGIVVDIGGTSTDVGLVKNGFPVRSLNISNIGGVALNFAMPDVLSIALGGGSYVLDKGRKIGPESVGKALLSSSVCFGGSILTLTDVALFLKHLSISGADTKNVNLTVHEANAVFESVNQKIEDLTLKMQGEHKNLPILIVGGGAALLPKEYFKAKYILPSHFSVANAFGAALSEISGMEDTIVSLQKRQSVLEDLVGKAKEKAIQLGANPSTLRLVDQQIIPYHYVPNQMARVIIRVSGKRNSSTQNWT